MFLRYRDTNYINAIRPSDMEAERARLAILGAIRFGKPLILDMMEVDMFGTAGDCFDRIMPGLLPAIMDKSILENEKYEFLCVFFSSFFSFLFTLCFIKTNSEYCRGAEAH